MVLNTVKAALSCLGPRAGAAAQQAARHLYPATASTLAEFTADRGAPCPGQHREQPAAACLRHCSSSSSGHGNNGTNGSNGQRGGGNQQGGAPNPVTLARTGTAKSYLPGGQLARLRQHVGGAAFPQDLFAQMLEEGDKHDTR